ncbi:restriction endonuclease subunit S [Desulfovibrio sp. X2]|uniref:restriction endonuclease subunit S n=1 Tax=Desulfovibrio sp. X2 TaxID=941449 RepID=UPI000426ED62|nr:restriction endonuclease subunit S [Desulfovibrio sp. X2]
MSFPRYPEYKDSGVEWLREVPSHWSVGPLRYAIARIDSGTSVNAKDMPAEEGEIGVLKTSCVYGGSFDPDENKAVLPEEFGRVSCPLKANTLIVSRMNTPDLVGAVGLVRIAQAGLYLPDRLWLVSFADAHPTFCYYWMRSASYRGQVQAVCSGTSSSMQNLSQGQFRSFIFPTPPMFEQSAIAAFLDRETGKIDALVAEQEKLIELLKEKRQAVISHAVTKGLDPTVLMKDSGIEWLGEMPEHWERVQLGRLCRQVSDGPHFSPAYEDEGVMFISARNIKVDGWSLDDVKFISERDYAEFSKRVIPDFGDVLYTKGGTTGIARVVDLKQKFQIWVHIAVLKLHHSMSNPYYVAYALNSRGCYEQSQLYTRGATNQDLGLTRMIKIWLALPPVSEQNEIVEHLNSATFELDQLIAEAQRAIDLLNERRSALISAAVTGKIDVRGIHPEMTEAI